MNQVDTLCNNYALRLKKKLAERDVLPDAISSIDYMRCVVDSEERHEEIRRSLGGFATIIDDVPAQQALGADIFKFDIPHKVGNWPFIHLLLAHKHPDEPASEEENRIEYAGLLVHGHLFDFKQEHPDLPIDTAQRNTPHPVSVELGEGINIRLDDTPLAAKIRLGLFAARHGGVRVGSRQDVVM